jgi:hypothetical protein
MLKRRAVSLHKRGNAMSDTAVLRSELRAALEELSDTINNLLNLLDSFDAAEAEDFGIAWAGDVEKENTADSEAARELQAR